MTPEPFRIDIPDAQLDDLRARLRQTRWAADFANDQWWYGTNGDWLHALVDHWQTSYDWRAHEAAMNSFPQFRVRLDGIPIHFVHVRGKGPAPIPLILTHGWPWTFWDYHAVIGPLSDPAAYGGDPADAFDVVVPSLPGFGFSTPLDVPGVNASRTADLWRQLMQDVLGYRRFAAQGGDWGAIVTAYLGHRYARDLIGIHLTFPALLGAGMRTVKPDDYAPDEAGWYDRMMERMKTAASHVSVHTNDPQTLAYALNDSPVGLAAWLLERRRNWSDSGGDPERPFTRDFLITTVMIYWLTQSIGTSMRYYIEHFTRPWKPDHDRQPAIEAPTAIAVFPQELVLLPKAVAEQHANLVRWTVMPAGGHFAAAEQPEAVVDDVRAHFRALR
jgi:pimeloyl-ACP methyl ester carboxylesterase